MSRFSGYRSTSEGEEGDLFWATKQNNKENVRRKKKKETKMRRNSKKKGSLLSIFVSFYALTNFLSVLWVCGLEKVSFFPMNGLEGFPPKSLGASGFCSWYTLLRVHYF